jgi:tetratricopeptide (TPR) repeat protein
LFATVPDDARYYLFLGSFLGRAGTLASSTEYIDKGIENLEKASSLSPDKQTILFEIGAAYINAGRYKEAVPYFKKAFDLEPSFGQARLLYGVALVYVGDLKTSDEVLKPLAGTPSMGDTRLVKAYYDTKQTKRVDDTIQYKIDMAQKLAAEGSKEEAIKQLQEVLSYTPSFKEEGERMIKEIQEAK